MRFVIREKKKPRGRGAIAGLLWFLFGGRLMGREIPPSLLANHRGPSYQPRPTTARSSLFTVYPISALAPKADIPSVETNVRYVPRADIVRAPTQLRGPTN